MPRPLVGVVVPMFNNAEHISECMESIIAQTYTEWQCVVVDNASTDDSLAIATKYSSLDPRITVVSSTTHLNVLQNHNRAIGYLPAGSAYCKIAFADDWIFPNCLHEMVMIAQANPSVGIVGAYVLEQNKVSSTGLPYTQTFLSGRQVCRLHLLDRIYLFGSANSLLYRATLVTGHKSFFDEGNIHADTNVCFLLLRDHDFGFVHQVLTFTRQREGSLTSKTSLLQTHLHAWLRLLLEHGDTYLTDEECRRLTEDHLRRHYRWLATTLLKGGSKILLQYHRSMLEALGVGFSWRRFSLGLAEVVFDAAGNPKLSAEKWLDSRTKRRALDHSTPIWD